MYASMKYEIVHVFIIHVVSYGFTFEQRSTRKDSNRPKTIRKTAATPKAKSNDEDHNNKRGQQTIPQVDIHREKTQAGQ